MEILIAINRTLKALRIYNQLEMQGIELDFVLEKNKNNLIWVLGTYKAALQIERPNYWMFAIVGGFSYRSILRKFP